MKRTAAFGTAFVALATTFVALPASADPLAPEPESYLETPVRAPSQAFELNVGTAYTQGIGDLRGAAGNQISQIGGPGIMVDLGAAYRLNPRWSLGATTCA
jgi:hypothetical protein